MPDKKWAIKCCFLWLGSKSKLAPSSPFHPFLPNDLSSSEAEGRRGVVSVFSDNSGRPNMAEEPSPANANTDTGCILTPTPRQTQV